MKLLVERTYNMSTICGRMWLMIINGCNTGTPIQLLLSIIELTIAYPLTDFFEASIVIFIKSSLYKKIKSTYESSTGATDVVNESYVHSVLITNVRQTIVLKQLSHPIVLN